MINVKYPVKQTIYRFKKFTIILIMDKIFFALIQTYSNKNKLNY